MLGCPPCILTRLQRPHAVRVFFPANRRVAAVRARKRTILMSALLRVYRGPEITMSCLTAAAAAAAATVPVERGAAQLCALCALPPLTSTGNDKTPRAGGVRGSRSFLVVNRFKR